MKSFLITLGTYFIDKVWPLIKSFISKLSFKDWLLIIVTILCIIFFFRMRYLSEKNLQNTLVYTETISDYENKIGELYKQITSYQVTLKDLKELNTDLYKEVLNLKENPLIITKTETKFRVDTIIMESEPVIAVSDSVYRLNWKYEQEPLYFRLSGFTDVKNDFTYYNSILSNLEVTNELTLDVIDNGLALSVIAKSSNPYVNITGMSSVTIDPTQCPSIQKQFKQKRWGIGPTLGICIDKNLHFTPYIGIGATYNVILF